MYVGWKGVDLLGWLGLSALSLSVGRLPSPALVCPQLTLPTDPGFFGEWRHYPPPTASQSCESPPWKADRLSLIGARRR